MRDELPTLPSMPASRPHPAPTEPRFITSPYAVNKYGEAFEECVYFRKEDIVNLIREKVTGAYDAQVMNNDLLALADTLEKIK